MNYSIMNLGICLIGDLGMPTISTVLLCLCSKKKFLYRPKLPYWCKEEVMGPFPPFSVEIPKFFFYSVRTPRKEPTPKISKSHSDTKFRTQISYKVIFCIFRIFRKSKNFFKTVKWPVIRPTGI